MPHLAKVIDFDPVHGATLSKFSAQLVHSLFFEVIQFSNVCVDQYRPLIECVDLKKYFLQLLKTVRQDFQSISDRFGVLQILN